MNAPQEFIDALSAELTRKFGPGTPSKYTVEVREPVEGELKVAADAKQMFITTEGFDFPEGVADQGELTRITVPVMLSVVMKRPSSVLMSAQTLARRLTVAQALQRVVKSFAYSHPEVMVTPLSEQPMLIEGYYVSVTGVELDFDLDCEVSL